MQELSLNVLDIAQNSIKAKATVIEIIIHKDTVKKFLSIKINDNGCGMTNEQVKRVTDPFFTTRTTRSVGLGVPFFKMSAELTGGTFVIESTVDVGTEIDAVYNYEHIDMLPIGDMAATMFSLISMNPDIDFVYRYSVNNNEFEMDTRNIRKIMGDVPLDNIEVLKFIEDFIGENQQEIEQN